jgi:hypothetical protein
MCRVLERDGRPPESDQGMGSQIFSNTEAAIAIAISLQYDLVRIIWALIEAEGLRVSATYNRQKP